MPFASSVVVSAAAAAAVVVVVVATAAAAAAAAVRSVNSASKNLFLSETMALAEAMLVSPLTACNIDMHSWSSSRTVSWS